MVPMQSLVPVILSVSSLPLSPREENVTSLLGDILSSTMNERSPFRPKNILCLVLKFSSHSPRDNITVPLLLPSDRRLVRLLNSPIHSARLSRTPIVEPLMTALPTTGEETTLPNLRAIIIVEASRPSVAPYNLTTHVVTRAFTTVP